MENWLASLQNFDLRSLLSARLKKADAPFWTAFFTLFAALNLVFLYHGANSLFGDHDWRYLLNTVPPSSGLFEGRFSQFLAINLLTRGEILPFLNNLFGLLGYSLGIALLARYWRLPHQKSAYVLFALFAGLTPYLLSFMYFAFLVIPCLSWNAVIILALIISEPKNSPSFIKTLPACLLFTLALGGYPPVINLFATALAARLFLAAVYEKASFSSLVKISRYSILNFLIAAILYKLILSLLTLTGEINTSYYNLQTISFAEIPSKLLLVTKDLFYAFAATLPFIPAAYKTAVTAVTLIALFSLFGSTSLKSPARYSSFKSSFPALFSLLALAYAPYVTLFLSSSLAETEFSPRIDFFGLAYFYAAAFAACLKSPRLLIKNLSLAAAAAAIVISTLSLFEAEKVWHLGFKAELSLYKRLYKRFSSDPKFDVNHRYIVIQGGSPSFRSRFYHTPYKYASADLLDIAYVPAFNSGLMWNYYGQKSFADPTAFVYNFVPDEAAKTFLHTIAAPYPAPTSTAVGAYWIITVLTPDGLNTLRSYYH